MITDLTNPDFIVDRAEQHARWPGVEIGYGCLIAPDVQIGEGTVIRNHVEIRSGVRIGRACYLDSQVVCTGNAEIGDRVTLRLGVIVARGSRIGDDSYLAPRVMFNNLDAERHSIGGAHVGERCFIGTHTVLHHGITVADGTTVGAMSFVNRDIPPDTSGGRVLWVGCPARRIVAPHTIQPGS